MDVILLERIEKLGQMGDIVNVKPGYARNYLLPQKKALRATESNRAVFEDQRTQLEAENLKQRQEAERVARDLETMTVVIVRQASDSDQLYGSVTTRDIAGSVTAAGVSVDRHQVLLDQPIKTVGLHPVRIHLHPEVLVEITANVARSEDEADMQARGERINRDGEIVSVQEEEEETIEVEAVFEEGAAPNAEELAANVTAAEELSEAQSDDDTEAEESEGEKPDA